MLSKIETFCKEYNLKYFYSIVLSKLKDNEHYDRLNDLINVAPFIRQFHAKFVNYYDLQKIPALNSQKVDHRLEEFYTDFCDNILTVGLEKSIPWLFSQKINIEMDFFPSHPIVIHYKDMMRGLACLAELIRNINILDIDVFQVVFDYVSDILDPIIDKTFEEEAKALLNQLIDFNARKEGIESDKFKLLTDSVLSINQQINHLLMNNNTFVSIVQQITEINKALKTVKKKTFSSLFSDQTEPLERFWKGLKGLGYTGGENYLYGDLENSKTALIEWLEKEFEQEKDALLEILDNTYNSEELPILDKKKMPEAIQMYALNLLGFLGLTTPESMRLVLGFHSRFVEKQVRDSAFTALKRNSETVRQYFLSSLREESDYEQKLLIAEKHDTIFDFIPAVDLTMAFGEPYRVELEKLDNIIAPEGILLSNFIRSAYMKFPGNNIETVDLIATERKHLDHFAYVNHQLSTFKAFVEKRSQGVFIKLLKMWGMNYIVSWALSDYFQERRLFDFLFEAAEGYNTFHLIAKERLIPLENVISLLSKEPDARDLIQKLMRFLLNSKISFDYPLFSSLFRVVAQRNRQLESGIHIRDGFSEQRGYSAGKQVDVADPNEQLQDPHIFHPIVIFLITVLHMKRINIPKDAFVETDISLYLNSLAGRQKNPELGYQMYLAHQLISSIPYIIDFASHHETVIRKTIADLDESYFRKNVLIHYLRIKIHRAPSKLDLDFCLEILDGLAHKDMKTVQSNLLRLMKGIGDEAIPDLTEYFNLYANKLINLGQYLKKFKSLYANTCWQKIAEDNNYTQNVRDLSGIDDESVRDVITLIKLVNALSNYWTQFINKEFMSTVFSEKELATFNDVDLPRRLSLVEEKRSQYQQIINRFDHHLEPYQHIFLKRHVIQGDWNFDFFGFWPYYKETKFETYNLDRKLSLLERSLLEEMESNLAEASARFDSVTEDVLVQLQQNIVCLEKIMTHLVNEGLAPSKFFLDTIAILQNDQLTVSQFHDILGILAYRELSHVDSFIAGTYGHFPAQITKALGRDNLDFGLDELSATDEELLYPLVQETVLGNIIAQARPIHLLEEHLNRMLQLTSHLVKINPSKKIYPTDSRPPRELTPVLLGYKSYALQTLAKDGFNVPALETIPVHFYQNNKHIIDSKNLSDYKTIIIERLLILEEKTKKIFDFPKNKLTLKQQNLIQSKRQIYDFDTQTAPQLLVSARSGSYRSMPGILGTVLNIGLRDVVNENCPAKELRQKLNTYRMFLSTFGNVVFEINEVSFSKIVSQEKKKIAKDPGKKIKWEDLTNDQIIVITKKFKKLIEEQNQKPNQSSRKQIDWNDPLELLALATIGVWNSWESEAARKLRTFLGISADWKTPVTLMEMKQADKNPQSFSAILFSGDPQGKTNKPNGDVLFGRPGEDIAAGLASEGTPLETIEEKDPELYHQIANLLEQIKINKGHINVDVELVGEYDEKTKKMDIFVLQERQMPLGVRGESEDYRLAPTDSAPIAVGKGVNGGVQHGVLLDGIDQDYRQLAKTVKKVRKQLGKKDEFHGPGIFLLMKYVTPEEALKMNIPGVDGVVTTKIGKSSHASISAKRDGKLFICETTIKTENGGWYIADKAIRLGNQDQPDFFTFVGNPKSVSPYSGNIYQGVMPLIKVKKKR